MRTDGGQGCRDDRRRREQRGAQLEGLHTHHGRSNGSRREQRGREGEDVVEAHGEVLNGWVVVLRGWMGGEYWGGCWVRMCEDGRQSMTLASRGDIDDRDTAVLTMWGHKGGYRGGAAVSVDGGRVVDSRAVSVDSRTKSVDAENVISRRAAAAGRKKRSHRRAALYIRRTAPSALDLTRQGGGKRRVNGQVPGTGP